MADPNDYEEEMQQIRDCIEETFKKLGKVWDEIGSHSRNRRGECKSQLICSCVAVISSHVNRIYNEELKVRTC